MSEYTITLTDEEEKAFKGICLTVDGWIQNVVHDRARVAIDHFVTKSGLGSKMTPQERKMEIIRDIDIPVLADHQMT